MPELPDYIDPLPSGDTERVYLSKAQWVELKTELSYGERKRLDLATFKGVQISNEQGDTSRTLQMDMASARALALALYVVDWNFTTAKGEPIKVPEPLKARIQFFESISERLGDAIAAEIDRIQARLSGDEADEDGPAALPNVIEGQARATTPASVNGSTDEPSPTSGFASGSAGPGQS